MSPLSIPPRQPCRRLDWSDRRNWAKHQKWTFQRGWVSAPGNKTQKHVLIIWFFLLLITIKRLHTRLTFKFSGQNWWPYMSMADRKMDSTWLCLSSYDGKCDAIKTCNTFKNNILSRNNETLKDYIQSIDREAGRMRCYLSGSQRHLRVLHLAELRELVQNDHQLIC